MTWSTAGPSIVLEELGKIVLPSGVLYLSHDEQRLHEHRHEDEELHMPPPGYTPPTTSPRFSKPLISLLISGVVGFHCCLGIVLYREYCRKTGAGGSGSGIIDRMGGSKYQNRKDSTNLTHVNIHNPPRATSGDEGGIRGSYGNKGRNRLGGNVAARGGSPT